MAARRITGKHLCVAAVFLLTTVWATDAIVDGLKERRNERERSRYLEGTNRIESSVELNYKEINSVEDLERKLGDRDEESSKGLYRNETEVTFWGGLIQATVVNGATVIRMDVSSSLAHPSSGYRGALYGVHIGEEHDNVVKHLSARLQGYCVFTTCDSSDENLYGPKSIRSCGVSCGNITFRWNEDSSRQVLGMSASNGLYVPR